MAFWSEVGSVRAVEDREVQVGVAQGSACYLCVQALIATSSKGYSQEKFQVDARGEPGTMNASGSSHRQVNAGRNLYLRAAGASEICAPSKECLYLRRSLDPIALAPLVNIGFKSHSFPVIIHA
jgi:hypothetical protein